MALKDFCTEDTGTFLKDLGSPSMENSGSSLESQSVKFHPGAIIDTEYVDYISTTGTNYTGTYTVPNTLPNDGVCPVCGRCKGCGYPKETQPVYPTYPAQLVYPNPYTPYMPYWGTTTKI